MKFEDTINYDFMEFLTGVTIIIGMIVFALLVIVALVAGSEEFKEHKKTKQGILCLLGVPIVIGIVALTLPSEWKAFQKVESGEEFQQRSRTSLENNILQKYDVDGIRFDGTNVLTGEDYYLSSTYTDEQAAMVIVDGNDYIFSLTQNPETFEPTLRNPPVNGGTSPDGIDAEDLLKNKKD